MECKKKWFQVGNSYFSTVIGGILALILIIILSLLLPRSRFILIIAFIFFLIYTIAIIHFFSLTRNGYVHPISIDHPKEFNYSQFVDYMFTNNHSIYKKNDKILFLLLQGRPFLYIVDGVRISFFISKISDYSMVYISSKNIKIMMEIDAFFALNQ